jgi:uncharacterized protein
MDEACFMPWVNLHHELGNLGLHITPDVYSFTVELGSEEVVSSDKAREDAARILYFLYKRGLIEENLVAELTPGKWSELENYQTYYAPFGGLFEPKVLPGQEFKQGDVLGLIYRPRAIHSFESLDAACEKIVANQAGAVINHTPTAIVHEGMELVQILSDLKSWP